MTEEATNKNKIEVPQPSLIYHAWFSNKQEDIRRSRNNGNTNIDVNCPGCVYWLSPENQKIQTTMVTKGLYHNCNDKHLDDLVYQGKVYKYSGICRW